MEQQDLIDQVIEQIANDFGQQDLSALEELLRATPEAALRAYLPESQTTGA